MSDNSSNPTFWADEVARTKAAAEAERAAGSVFPVAGLEGALHISTGGASFPGGIWIDGVKVK